MSIEYKITIFDGHRTCSYEEWLGKSQMTREEAFEKAKSIGNNSPWYEDTVRLLEALGLIKFEEPSSKVNR